MYTSVHIYVYVYVICTSVHVYVYLHIFRSWLSAQWNHHEICYIYTHIHFLYIYICLYTYISGVTLSIVKSRLNLLHSYVYICMYINMSIYICFRSDSFNSGAKIKSASTARRLEHAENSGVRTSWTWGSYWWSKQVFYVYFWMSCCLSVCLPVSLYLALSLSPSLSLSLSHTHTHTHFLPLSLSLSLSGIRTQQIWKSYWS